MVQQIQPSSNFPISRLLPDLGDGVTYYMQAVIRAAGNQGTYTAGQVLATVNLPTQGNRIFGAIWRTIADPIGQGVYITITTTAYTDSAYTQAATNTYSAQMDTYFIYDQYNYLRFLSTQIGAQIPDPGNVDYKKIEKLIKAAIKLIEFPEQSQTDYSPHFKQLASDLKQAIADKEVTEIPEYPELDLSPLHEAIKGSESRLHERFDKLPEPTPATDLSPVLEAIKSTDFKDAAEKVKQVAAITTEFKSRMDKTMPELGKYFDEIIKHMKDLLYATAAREQIREPKQIPSGPVMTRRGAIRS